MVLVALAWHVNLAACVHVSVVPGATEERAKCLREMAEGRGGAPAPATSSGGSFDKIRERVAVLVITGTHVLHTRGTAVLETWGRRLLHMVIGSDEREDWPQTTGNSGSGVLGHAPQRETFHAIEHLKVHDIQIPPGWADKGALVTRAPRSGGYRS